MGNNGLRIYVMGVREWIMTELAFEFVLYGQLRYCQEETEKERRGKAF